MFNSEVKAVRVNNKNKCIQQQQKNILTINKKSRKPKVHFDISKHLRILNQNVPEIESESAEIPELRTVCDIDNTFYKVIEGRPLRQFIDVKVYMRNLRDITLYRANAAYLKDQIIRIDTNIADEFKQYNIIYKLYNKTKTNFFHFVEESYDTANKIQQDAKETSEELTYKINDLNILGFTHVKLNNKMGSLAAAFGSLVRYGNFLNQMSPMQWIIQNDIKNSNFMKIFEEAESHPTRSFEIYKTYFSSASATKKIYFRRPQQLIRIFDAISRQCLNYLQIQNYFASFVKPVLKSRDRLEIRISEEVKEVTDLIVFYEQQVKWMEEKEAEYKHKFNKLLFKQFQDLYASYDSTKLFTCVQYIHFRIFQGPEDPRDKITTLVLDIEKLYLNLTSRLDCLNQEVVKTVKYEVFSSDIKIMKRATKAQRILKECNILKKSLISSFEPPRYFEKKCLSKSVSFINELYIYCYIGIKRNKLVVFKLM